MGESDRLTVVVLLEMPARDKTLRRAVTMLRRIAPGQKLFLDGDGPILDTDGNGLYSEAVLVAVALAIGARGAWLVGGGRAACTSTAAGSQGLVAEVRERVCGGEDPLGEAFCNLRLPAQRRTKGTTFTPRTIVDAMVEWAAEPPSPPPQRIIDPGTGSGRYLLAAGRRIRNASLLGIEIDPLPAILARANLAAAGLAQRAQIVLGDYRSLSLPQIAGPTLYIGNPPMSATTCSTHGGRLG